MRQCLQRTDAQQVSCGADADRRGPPEARQDARQGPGGSAPPPQAAPGRPA